MISTVIQSYIVSLKRFTSQEQNELNRRYNLEESISPEIFNKLSDEEKEIFQLMRILYKMDELTDEENIEARIVFAKETSVLNILQKKLELMIKIKQQIIGKRVRKFNINRRYARAMHPNTRDTIIYAQLQDNNVIQLSGYVDVILDHHKTLYGNKNVVIGYFGYDADNQNDAKYGRWFISGDFRILEWQHASEKNESYDTSFPELKD